MKRKNFLDLVAVVEAIWGVPWQVMLYSSSAGTRPTGHYDRLEGLTTTTEPLTVVDSQSGESRAER
jgi:hypothetical protein